MPRPLEGVRVLEVCSFISGPLAGAMLADLGAEVIKIEPPTGDPGRRFGRPATDVSPEFASMNRGKRSVALDLKLPDERAALLRLVETSDVYMCNWRPGVADRLGLGDDVIASVNPAIVRVYISGYGPTGPDVDAPVFDSVVQARSGLTHAASGSDEPVLLAGFPVDKVTSGFAVQAVLAGLLARRRDGVGDRIDVSMLDAASYFDFVELFANRTFLDHQPAEATSSRATMLRPLPASDGWLVLAPVAGEQIKAACHAVGHPEWISELRAIQDASESSRSFYDRLRDVLSTGTVAHWIDTFRTFDVPAAPCSTVDGHFEDPQVVHNALYEIEEWPGLGRVRTVRYPAMFSATGALRACGPAPEIGQDTHVYTGRRAAEGEP